MLLVQQNLGIQFVKCIVLARQPEDTEGVRLTGITSWVNPQMRTLGNPASLMAKGGTLCHIRYTVLYHLSSILCTMHTQHLRLIFSLFILFTEQFSLLKLPGITFLFSFVLRVFTSWSFHLYQQQTDQVFNLGLFRKKNQRASRVEEKTVSNVPSNFLLFSFLKKNLCPYFIV